MLGVDCLDCLEASFTKPTNQCIRAPLCVSNASFCGVAHVVRAAQSPGGYMAAYRPTEQRELSRAMRGLRRDRDRSVPCVGWSDANTVCVSCGLTLVDSPFQARDYFDVIMRIGRPLGRAARLRRAG